MTNIEGCPSDKLQIIAVGENSFSYRLAAKLFEDFLYNSRTCTLECDDETHDLAFIPDAAIIANEKRCVLLFVDMNVRMSIAKLKTFISQLKEMSIPVILYASVGTVLSMAYSSSDMAEFNYIRDMALSLRKDLFALFLMPFDFTRRLIVDWGDEDSNVCYPANTLLFGQNWQDIVINYPNLYSNIAYCIIQKFQSELYTTKEQLPMINADFVRTLTRQIHQPSTYRLHILGNEELTQEQSMEITDKLRLAKGTSLGISSRSNEPLTDKLILMFCFGYSFQESTLDQPTCLAVNAKEGIKIEDDCLVVECLGENFGLLNWAATLKSSIISNNKNFFFGVVTGLLETQLKRKPSLELLSKTANDLYPLATIMEGDTLVVNLNDYIWVGKVSETKNMVNKIPVTWQKQAFPKKMLSNQLQAVLNFEQLSLDISDFSEEISSVISIKQEG